MQGINNYRLVIETSGVIMIALKEHEPSLSDHLFVFKLVNGQTIAAITTAAEDGSAFLLQWPYLLTLESDDDGDCDICMSPWMLGGGQPACNIAAEDVLTIYKPSESLIHEYAEAILEDNALLSKECKQLQSKPATAVKKKTIWEDDSWLERFRTPPPSTTSVTSVS